MGGPVECSGRVDVGRRSHLPRVWPDVPSVAADAGIPVPAVSGDRTETPPPESSAGQEVARRGGRTTRKGIG